MFLIIFDIALSTYTIVGKHSWRTHIGRINVAVVAQSVALGIRGAPHKLAEYPQINYLGCPDNLSGDPHI